MGSHQEIYGRNVTSFDFAEYNNKVTIFR